MNFDDKEEWEYYQMKAEEADDTRRASEYAAAQAEIQAEEWAHEKPIDEVEAAFLVTEEARRYFEEQLAAIGTAAIREVAELDGQVKALKARIEEHIRIHEGGE